MHGSALLVGRLIIYIFLYPKMRHKVEGEISVGWYHPYLLL